MINAWMTLLCALVTIAVIGGVAGENEGLGFPDMTSGLNAVPRIGRRSFGSNPFGDRGFGSGFRFVRDRRWPGWPGLHHFRFRDDSLPDVSAVAGEMHKRGDGDTDEMTKRDPSPSPHPLPRPYATVKTDQQAFWEDLVSEAARN